MLDNVTFDGFFANSPALQWLSGRPDAWGFQAKAMI